MGITLLFGAVQSGGGFLTYFAFDLFFLVLSVLSSSVFVPTSETNDRAGTVCTQTLLLVVTFFM